MLLGRGELCRAFKRHGGEVILERSLDVCRVGGFGTRQLRHRVLNQKYSIISRTMYKTYYFRDEASK